MTRQMEDRWFRLLACKVAADQNQVEEAFSVEMENFLPLGARRTVGDEANPNCKERENLTVVM